MADGDRPPWALEKVVPTLVGIVGIGGAFVGAVLWFASLQGGLTQVQASQVAQGIRIDRIEQSRAIGMERLAKSEEAIAGLKDTLAKIDGKMDRLLSRGR